MIRFIKNIWFFRKELWNHKDFDYIFSLIMLRRSLQGLERSIRINNSAGSFRWDNILKTLNETICILKSIEDGDYVEKAREALILEFKNEEAYKEENGSYRLVDSPGHHAKVFNRAIELEEKEWRRLFVLLAGEKGKHRKNYGMRYWWH
jgi:hypothetical protein